MLGLAVLFVIGVYLLVQLVLKFRACSNLLLARYCPAVTAFRFVAFQWQRT